MEQLPGVRQNPRVISGRMSRRGERLQVVLRAPEYAELARWRALVMARMEDDPGLFSVDSDYQETRPQMRVQIDRRRAADLGVSVTDIGHALETMMGGRRVTTFVQDGEE